MSLQLAPDKRNILTKGSGTVDSRIVDTEHRSSFFFFGGHCPRSCRVGTGRPRRPGLTGSHGGGSSMVRPLAGRPTTAERTVHTILQQRILDGILRPGERIDLDAIAQELQVSRTPVRTALRQLESEGLVTIYPHRAVMVSELSA